MSSLRSRLLLAMVMTIVLCWVVSLALLYMFTAHGQAGVWDSKLQSIATKIILAIPAGKTLSEQGPGLQLRDRMRYDDESMTFQVWVDRGYMAIHAPGGPASPLRPDFIDGAASTLIDGKVWRVYSISDSTGSVHVQVGNLQAAIDNEVRRKALLALGIASGMMVLVGLLMWKALYHSLTPVIAIGATLRERKKFDLTPLPVAPLPRELRPLVASFNHLMAQLDQAVESERRFIGDAAHELRTPLSALQAQAEVALRAAGMEEKDAALVKLLAVAKRSTRLSEQLLDLARLDAGVRAPHTALADLSELIVYVAGEFDVGAQQSKRTIVLDAAACEIACDIDEIGILLRNLVDNALRYTGQGGRVRISCGYRVRAEQEVVLEVADDGPGVPVDEREAIFSRFYRAAGSGGRGSGIGLSLVAGIARLHGARIETGSGLGGLGFSVRVVFSRPPMPIL